MRVTIIAHASVLVELGQDRILVDPVFDDVFASDTLCFHPARRIDVDALIGMTSLVVVTHIHLDHFHPPSLQRFPRDTPIVLPPHLALVEAIRNLGFTRLIELGPWERHELEGGSLTATPSDFELEELGLVFSRDGLHYWHMSDAIVTEPVGQEVYRRFGAVTLLSTKYQPLRTLIGYQRGLQSTMLDRDELVAGFEAACATRPRQVFPYFSGFAFHGEHAWANRHVAPYRDDEIARLLQRRLGDTARVGTVRPGDLFELAGHDCRQHRGVATFVAPAHGPHVAEWEPIDPDTLAGVAGPGERAWLKLELDALLSREVLPWLRAHLDRQTGLFDLYRQYRAIWQAAVHLGEEHRLLYAIDFNGDTPRLSVGRHPDAQVFSHISGRSLLRVLRGDAGAELFWMAGGYRVYEKLLLLENNRLIEPPLRDWALFERLPDPITHYLRKMGRRRIQMAGS